MLTLYPLHHSTHTSWRMELGNSGVTVDGAQHCALKDARKRGGRNGSKLTAISDDSGTRCDEAIEHSVNR